MNGHGVSSNEITSIDDFEIDIKPSLLEGDVEEQQLQQQPSMISNWSIAPPEHQQQQQQNDHSPQTQPITSDPSSSSPSPATTPVPAQQVPTKLKRSKSSEGGNKPSKKRATLTPLPSIASSGSPSRASGSPKRVSLTNSKSPLLDEDEDEEDCSCPITYCQTCGRRRARWTNALHQKFLAALEKLGMKAVPSELLQEMNVPHLTREQVASHLQKFRRKYPIDKATSQPNWNSIKTKEESHSSKTNSPPMLSSTKSSSTKATKKSSTSKPKVKKEKTSLKTSSSAVVPSAPSTSPSVSPVTVQPAPAVPLRTSSQAVLPSLPAPPTVHPQQQQAQQQQQRTSISYQIPTVPAELPPIENSQWDVNSDPFVRSMQDLVWYVDNNNGNSNNTGVAGTSAGYPPMTQTPQYTPTNNYSPSYYSQPASSPQGFSPNYHPTFSAMPHLPQQQQPSQQSQHSQRPPYFPTHQQQPPPQLQQFQQPPPLQPQFQQQQQQHPSQHTQPQRQHQQQHQLHQQLNLGYPPS